MTLLNCVTELGVLILVLVYTAILEVLTISASQVKMVWSFMSCQECKFIINFHCQNHIYSLFRWSRDCDLLEDRIYEFADNTEISGWLEIKTASPGFDIKYRVPGTTFQYRCSTGFELPTNENPDQNLVCQGNKRVFTDDIVTCVRKLYHI